MVRLLSLVQKAARNSPTTVGTKFMLEQQEAAFIIEDKRAGGDGEAPLPDPYESPADSAGKIPPDRTEEPREHERSIARRLCATVDESGR